MIALMAALSNEKHGRSELDANNATQIKTEMCVEKLLLPVFLLALMKVEREIQFVFACVTMHAQYRPRHMRKKHLI